MTVDSFWKAAAETDDPLRDELMSMIRKRYHATPRHMQVELGPSEVGHPCMRKIAYGLMVVPRSNPENDPLASIVGTAPHSWLDSAAQHANQVLGRERWLTEHRVEVQGGLSGSCDLYDVDTGTVIDWKVPGNTSYDRNVKDVSKVYRNQVHLYGRGFERLGYPVKYVAIAFLPKSKTLNGLYLFKEEYNPALVDAVLARYNATIELLDSLRPEINPDAYHWIPAEPYECVYCPQYRPNPSSPFQCGGQK